jgi:excisionase family DNA binding protein
MAQNDDILTITELSEHLRVHPTTIYRLLRQGRIPGFRVGSAWRFSRTAIEKWEGTDGGMIENHSPKVHRRPSQSNSKSRKKK